VAFDVASVKPSPLPRNKKGADFRYGPQGIEAAAYPLNGLIIEAYDARPSRIQSDSHVKDLLGSVYDLIAKAEQPTPKEQLRLMLRALLAERFQLAVHQESKEQPVYRLIVGKQGPRIEKSTAEVAIPRYSLGAGKLAVTDATIAQFCERLSTALDRPVLDGTGISGVYNFHLTLDDMPPKGSGLDLTASSIFTDIQRELGLKLVPDKAVVEYLMIDRVEKLIEN